MASADGATSLLMDVVLLLSETAAVASATWVGWGWGGGGCLQNPTELHRAANHYILVVVYYAWGHSTTLLHSWSYHTPPKKQKLFLFNPVCACGHQTCQQPAAHVPFLCLVLVGYAQPTGVHVLNQLTSCSVQFNSRSFASLPGKTSSVFNHFKSLSWKWARW